MARKHVVTLAIGAEPVEVSTWDELVITLDMLRPGSPWTATLWRSASGAAWQRARDLAKLYAPVELRVDGAVQIRGVIERIRDHADRSGAPLTISGRDTLAAAMVADVDPRLSLRDATLEEAFERVLSPLGINVTVGASAADVRAVQAGARPGTRTPTSARTRRRQRVDRFRPQVGQRSWEFLQQLARRHGYMIFTGPAGDGTGLIIDRPAYDAPPQGELRRKRRADGTYEGNILAGTLDLDVTDVPTDVTVFGRTRLDVMQDARHSAAVTNTRLTIRRIADVYLPRPRYLRDPRARTPQIAEQRGRHAIARAMQDFAVFEAVVQGFSWGSQERLWTINTMVTLDDEATGVRGNWLCTGVTFNRSRAGGHTTRLRLVPPGSIDLEPDPEA